MFIIKRKGGYIQGLAAACVELRPSNPLIRLIVSASIAVFTSPVHVANNHIIMHWRTT